MDTTLSEGPAETDSATESETAAPTAPATAPAPVHPRMRDASGRRRLSLNLIYGWYIRPVIWRLMNPGRTPEDYYAETINNRLRRGRKHPAIGGNARAVRAPTELLDILLGYGLQPRHAVVDYGCGSFRLGKALIEYLEPGRYWGLDPVDEFLQAGIQLLEPELLAEKRPNPRLITPENLAEARQAAPDFIISWHVCSKVPASRLPDYFGKIIALMGPDSVALVHFPEAAQRTRQSCFSWAQSREGIAAAIHRVDPSLAVRFAPVTDQINRGIRQTMVEIRRP